MQKPKKGTAKKPVTKTTVVKPTADSTNFYNAQAKINFQKASDRYGLASPKMQKEAAKYTTKAFKAQDDALRQLNKGKPGYDKNGFPIKKSKKGGIVKAKRK